MKRTKQQAIPVFRMETQSPLGIEFSYMEMTDGYDEFMMNSPKNIIHRDDHYLFLFMDIGDALFTVDFEDIRITGSAIFYVRPGQVHFVSSLRDAKGWFLAIDAMLVEKAYKNIFEGQFYTQRPINLDAPISARLDDAARLLYDVREEEPASFSDVVTLNLANAYIGMIAGQYADSQDKLQQRASRSSMIAQQFKELLSENYKTVKSPTQYAEKLNYSLSHLNESVKNITGFPVSYWIHQQVVLEAKRLLYYTDMDVKEVAYSLGYEDHTYFSRLFSKVVGSPPGAFRNKFQK